MLKISSHTKENNNMNMKSLSVVAASLAAVLMGCTSDKAVQNSRALGGAKSSLSGYDLDVALPDETTTKFGNTKSNTDIINNQSAINHGVARNLESNSGNISDEVAMRTLSDTILSAGVSDNVANLTNQIAMVNARVTTEAASRASADSIIRDTLELETNSRIDGDNAISKNMTNEVSRVIMNHDFVMGSFEQSTGEISYTQHPVEVTLADGGVIVPVGEWPNSKPVFLYVKPAGSYTVNNATQLGYGTWPTANFQAVMWYVKGKWLVNVLMVETAE